MPSHPTLGIIIQHVNIRDANRVVCSVRVINGMLHTTYLFMRNETGTCIDQPEKKSVQSWCLDWCVGRVRAANKNGLFITYCVTCKPKLVANCSTQVIFGTADRRLPKPVWRQKWPGMVVKASTVCVLNKPPRWFLSGIKERAGPTH